MKLLFISPIFFDYEKKIKKVLESQYSNVIFKSEIPFNSTFIYYALKRINKSVAHFFLMRYNHQLLELIQQEKIDRIFIIRGFGLNENFFRSLKSIRRDIHIFHYQWDSLSIVPNGEMISRYANYNYSFDLKDTISNIQFKHLPLFYTENKPKESALSKKDAQEIDLLFIGSYHSSRNEIVAKAHVACEKHGLKFKSHIYMPFFSYLRNILTTNDVNFKDISFKKIPYKKYQSMLDHTKVVLDIPYSTQTGATMRTIETLSKGKKLVSTNNMLESELFYSSDNIQFWNTHDELKLTSLISSDFDHSKDKYLFNIEEWLIQIGVLKI